MKSDCHLASQNIDSIVMQIMKIKIAFIPQDKLTGDPPAAAA